MSLDAVLKIGGSLSRGDELPGLCREISRLGRKRPLLVVPGGGQFADQVRDACRKFSLHETSAHRMALLAMDQYGYLLSDLIGNACSTPMLPEGIRAAETGRTAILLPAAIVMESDPLPHSWQVTSDTIAAWVAQQAGCPRLVLLKDVDGLMAGDGDVIDEMTPKELSGHAGGVDEYLAHFLASSSPGITETWIVNGGFPGRLTELLEKGRTAGTRIRAEKPLSPES